MLGQQKEGESWPSQPVPRHYLKKKAGSQVVSQKKPVSQASGEKTCDRVGLEKNRGRER